MRERGDPLLVVREPIIRVGRQRLDVLAQLVDRHQPFFPLDSGAQHHERVYPALPVFVVMLGGPDLLGRLPAHVVVAAKNTHATHSETGALASCSGWQTTSTSVGLPRASACFNASCSFAGSVTLKARSPKASATFAWSVTPKSTEK